VTTLGVCLLLVGAIVIVAETHVPALGMLGGPGVIALGVGAVLTVSGLGGGVALAAATAVALVAAGVGVLALSLRKAVGVRRRRVGAGPERLVGQLGVLRSWSEPSGKVLVDGALWSARRSWDDGDGALREGDSVVVERRDGLTLAVRRAEEWEVLR